MAYHSRKYPKFSQGDKILIKTKDNEQDIVQQSFLDLTNDRWDYRLVNANGWFSEDDLEKVVEVKLEEVKQEEKENGVYLSQ